MVKHSDYITHIDNEEDEVYLKSVHFPVNMRLFNTSKEYKHIILQQCEYLKKLVLEEKEGYKKPHGMSSANAGLSFNIIAILVNRNKSNEYPLIMINPKILKYEGSIIISKSNCGSLTLKDPIKVKRFSDIRVEYYNEAGQYLKSVFNAYNGSLTIQHEIDHNNGILITDRQ